MSGDTSKGRIVGFLALGALVALLGVAFYSGRAKTPPQNGSAAAPAARTPGAEPVASPSGSQLETAPGGSVTEVLEDIALSPQARLMAERFKCVCGCNLILATCTCNKTPGSKDMKKYLQQLVDEGKSPADIEHAMVDRYGEDVIP